MLIVVQGVRYPLYIWSLLFAILPFYKFGSPPSKFAVNYHYCTIEKGDSQTTDTLSKPPLLNVDSYQGRKETKRVI